MTRYVNVLSVIADAPDCFVLYEIVKPHVVTFIYKRRHVYCHLLKTPIYGVTLQDKIHMLHQWKIAIDNYSQRQEMRKSW